MPLRGVKPWSICHVYTEIHFVTYNRHILKNVREGESEDKSVCSQVLLISLNTEKQFQT